MSLSAKDFLSPKRLKSEAIDLPSGGTVNVRALTVGQREDFAEMGSKPETRPALGRFLAAKCCVDDEGSRIFSDDAIDALKDAPAEDVEAIASAVMRLSGVAKLKDEDDDPNA